MCRLGFSCFWQLNNLLNNLRIFSSGFIIFSLSIPHQLHSLLRAANIWIMDFWTLFRLVPNLSGASVLCFETIIASYVSWHPVWRIVKCTPLSWWSANPYLSCRRISQHGPLQDICIARNSNGINKNINNKKFPNGKPFWTCRGILNMSADARCRVTTW